MTGSDVKSSPEPRPSTLPFDANDMMAIRVTQADLARMWQVSKQAVNQWVRKGIISTFPDGSIDPKKALKEYLANTDGSRMRARFMRTVSAEVDNLKRTNQHLAEQLAQKHDRLQYALTMLAEHSIWLERFSDLVASEKNRLCNCTDADAWAQVVQELFDRASEGALGVDPAEALPRIDSALAAHYRAPEDTPVK